MSALGGHKKHLYILIAIFSCIVAASLLRHDTAEAANMSAFNPGRIIDDAVFYNKDSMTVAQIQSFLDSKVPTCNTYQNSTKTYEAAPCLKDYRETTNVKSADAFCKGYPEANQSAAEIIHGVAQSCDINPQVLIVTLQKEQGLVTDTWPRDSWLAGVSGVNYQYRSAMGYGCPDTALCDSVFYGLFNQVYYAARQFKRYQASPSSYSYVAGRNNNIQWHPSASCGASSVYIENQATAGLYNYTPYQPNQAALNSSYGAGDSCSAYGNRNFYSYFTDWFGSTQYSVGGSIKEHYDFIGAEDSVLGRPVANQSATSRWGYYQRFENGYIIGKWDTGYWVIRGNIRTQYVAAGLEHGALGFPIEDEYRVAAKEGNKQSFEYGYIIGRWDTGYWSLRGSIRAQYDSLEAENGDLGLPTTNETPTNSGGNQQLFEGGMVVGRWDTKYWAITNEIFAHYKEIGDTDSAIGYPIQPELTTKNGSYQRFQNGYIIGNDRVGYWVVRGGIRTYYAAELRAEHGELGLPVGLEFIEDGQNRQNFENGYIIGKDGKYTHYLNQ